MKIHPTFHVSLLRPAAEESDYLPGQHVSAPAPVVIDGEEEYTVKSVERLRYNKRRKRHEYLVIWQGYDETTWEPAVDLKDVTAITEFHKKFPAIPEPPEIAVRTVTNTSATTLARARV